MLSRDEEGNGFGELTSVSSKNNLFNRDEGEVGLEYLTPDLEKQRYTSEDIGEGDPAVVLWP